ncbi:MAG: hypothetical protein GY756_27080 [bacterium]|nr:hypothetical protein [bacterium]
MEKLKEIQKLCNGIEYNRDVPKEAKKLAKENNIVIIVGGSDDLMYCYGAESYLTDYIEHSEGWDGCDLTKDASDNELKKEAQQLGLKIFWCGKIENTGESIENYSTLESGAFSYQVKEGIEHETFKVMEDDNDVYCTGIIIKLPDNFETGL